MQAAKSGRVNRIASGPAPTAGKPYVLLAVCGLLVVAVALVFGQTVMHEFVNFDDNINVYQNPMVTAGVTRKGLVWAFLHPRNVDYWRPLTFLSHMLDCQFYRLWAGGHHLTNVLLHLAAAVALFLVLRAMTGGMWRSAFVAAVFAVHPLRVESVAWVTERKDVLSGLFFVLTLAAYVRYARQPALGRYGAVAALFAAGLMCKPTLVPLPLVLLLLDYWPLGRLGAGRGKAEGGKRKGEGGEQGAGRGKAEGGRRKGETGEQETRKAGDSSFVIRHWSFPQRLVLEKLPLLALAAASCFVSTLTGKNALQPVKDVPLLMRTGNALVSVLMYLRQLFWPAGLAPWYPNPKGGPAIWAMALAVVALAAASAAVIAVRRRQPWLPTGWFWYLAMLAPTLSMSQAHMDRFTYLSQIGLVIALAWMPVCRNRWLAFSVTVVCLPVLACLAWLQADCWKNSETLWSSTLQRTSRNYVAENNLGVTLESLGRPKEAIQHYRKALEVFPSDVDADSNLRMALYDLGQIDEALKDCRGHLPLRSSDAEIHYKFGVALQERGRIEDAIICYCRAIEIQPDSAKAHNNMAVARAQIGMLPAAIAEWRKTIEIDPKHASARQNLGEALVQVGQPAAALSVLREGLNRDARNANLLRATAWILATSSDPALRNGTEAVTLAEQAQAIAAKDVDVLDTLAAAYAETGRFGAALQSARMAIELAEAAGNRPLAEAIRGRVRFYQAGKPWRDSPRAVEGKI